MMHYFFICLKYMLLFHPYEISKIIKWDDYLNFIIAKIIMRGSLPTVNFCLLRWQFKTGPVT